MTPAARIKAALDILERVKISPVPMDTTIGDYMRFKRYIGAKDRAAVVENAYDIVRHKARLEWWLTHLKAEITPRAMMLAKLALVDKQNVKRAKDLFDGSKYGAEELTDDELKLVAAMEGQDINHPEMPENVRVECPPEHEAALRDYFGKNFAAEMEAMLTGASLDIRVNAILAPREKVQETLAKDGVETDETKWAREGLRVKGKTYLSKTKAFVKGWIDIQDEGSQLIATACNARPGMQVLDFCAGAGGKTLALANDMKVKGRIVAMDLEEARLEKGRERFRRARVTDIIEVRPLKDEQHRRWLRRQDEKFDVVLTDVPCSGTGTWRRNPDTRWRVYGPSLDELLKTQAEILDKIAPVVKPGGRLVYATCSLLPQENEKQVEAFLARNQNFRLLPIDKAWPQDLDVPCEGPYMRLTPKQHNTDGFFAAVLLRQENPEGSTPASDEDDE